MKKVVKCLSDKSLSLVMKIMRVKEAVIQVMLRKMKKTKMKNLKAEEAQAMI
jgi:hypothetical protein